MLYLLPRRLTSFSNLISTFLILWLTIFVSNYLIIFLILWYYLGKLTILAISLTQSKNRKIWEKSFEYSLYIFHVIEECNSGLALILWYIEGFWLQHPPFVDKKELAHPLLLFSKLEVEFKKGNLLLWGSRVREKN